MKTIIYIRVYIEGKEENLPKETGWYFCGIKSKYVVSKYLNRYDNRSINEWLERVTWYLMPKELPDDEEIFTEADKYKGNVNLPEILFEKGVKWYESQILNK